MRGCFGNRLIGYVPIENCYWVLPGKLLAGEYPRDIDEQVTQKKINALLSFGITVFIDLTEKDEGLLPYMQLLGDSAVHKRFPIRDMSVPATLLQTINILGTIDTHIDRGELVYIHCWGGIGRTGTIVGCWLARHGGGVVALARLHELWQQCQKSEYRQSPETREQERYILSWEAGQ